MPRSAPPNCTYVGVSEARTTISRTSRLCVAMTSLRERSGSSLGWIPARASRGAVSSKIRPFDNAILMLAIGHTRFSAVTSALAGAAILPESQALAIGPLLDVADLRAERAELLLQRLVAAVEVVDAIDDGLPLGREPGDDQSGRRTQVGRHDVRTLQARYAAHDRRVALDGDVGAQALQLERVHEAILENSLGDDRRALRHGSERHELRLHVRGEARIRRGADAHGVRPAGHFQLDGLFADADRRPRLAQLLERGVEAFRRHPD